MLPQRPVGAVRTVAVPRASLAAFKREKSKTASLQTTVENSWNSGTFNNREYHLITRSNSATYIRWLICEILKQIVTNTIDIELHYSTQSVSPYQHLWEGRDAPKYAQGVSFPTYVSQT